MPTARDGPKPRCSSDAAAEFYREVHGLGEFAHGTGDDMADIGGAPASSRCLEILDIEVGLALNAKCRGSPVCSCRSGAVASWSGAGWANDIPRVSLRRPVSSRSSFRFRPKCSVVARRGGGSSMDVKTRAGVCRDPVRPACVGDQGACDDFRFGRRGDKVWCRRQPGREAAEDKSADGRTVSRELKAR